MSINKKSVWETVNCCKLSGLVETLENIFSGSCSLNKDSEMNTRKNSKKGAFTLAEVLITLGVIGVVAAMTLPIVVGNYQKKATVTQLKKAYSILSQAIKASEVDNGELKSWNLSNTSGVKAWETYFKNYIRYYEVGSTPSLVVHYKWLDGRGVQGDGIFSSYANRYIKSADGMIFIFAGGHVNSYNMYLGVDVNGLKKPNQLGKDLFYFVLSNKYGLRAWGDHGMDGGLPTRLMSNRNNITTGQQGSACNKNSSGRYCTALIIYDNWEMKNDYPW